MPERSLTAPIPKVLTLCEKIRDAGGRAFMVGGAVRDNILGLPMKDYDLEVYGLPTSKLERLLRSHDAIDTVGKSFGVFKLKNDPIDVALPRKESKSGTGHRGFEIKGDPNLPVEEAATRRDFTINALYWDPLTRELIDPCNGEADLNTRTLRHVGPQFSEDPLRVLRGMQFVARFELTAAPETIALCQKITPEDLPKERLFGEWQKLITKGTRPSLGLQFLKDTGWIQYTPELAALIDCAQDPEFHPEGDVWVHTCHCLDAFARQKTGNPWEDLVVGFAVLCHDLAKPDTSFTDEDGRIRSPGHEAAGAPIAENFLKRLTDHKELIESVLPLVANHMAPVALYKAQSSDAAIRRLARRVGRIDRLLRVVRADFGGRPPLDPSAEQLAAIQWVQQKAESLNVQNQSPKPIVLGRHLIEEGLMPSPLFKEVLGECFDAQIEGTFTDLTGGIAYMRGLLKKKNLR